MIFIAGVPATGKTFIGDILRDKFDFLHIDVEKLLVGNPSYEELESQISKSIEEATSQQKKGVVITWGFSPTNGWSIEQIKKLQNEGFEFVWFIADEATAKDEFLKRGTGTINEFDAQMARIKKFDIYQFRSLKIIEVFSGDTRKSTDEIVGQMLT